MEALKSAAEAGDVAAFTALLADDIILNSPLTTRIRFEGKEQVRALFVHVFHHIQDIRFYQMMNDGDNMHAIFWRGRVGKQYLEEANLIRLNDQGQIAEMTVFMRALPGLLGLAEGLVPSLTRQNRGPIRAFIIRLMLSFVAVLYRSNEGLVVSMSGAGVPVRERDSPPL